jgi:hypothetical protein
MLSREGPKAATADVNADGLEDVFIGGTKGHPGQLYLQNEEGKFSRKEENAFQQFSDFEDVAVRFFDCDKDGDPDLLVCPGGNNALPNSRELQLRLFKNDGKGNFELDAEAFPVTNANISVAIANDFDGDGDQDLFVGGRSVPREYGSTPPSYLFVNDGKGHFKDLTASLNKDIAGIGMVTGAVWFDQDGDGKKELAIAGEWMTPRIFSFIKDHFEEQKTELAEMYGWWQTITAADLDHDGKEDLILGNIGENFYLHPDEKHPVKLWVSDFDQNGIIDKVMSYTVDGKDKPVFLKRDLEEAMPFLKKQNLKHEIYANKSVQDLLPAGQLDKAIFRQFNFASSCIAFSRGKGKYQIKKLPAMTQLSSVNVIYVKDMNADGIKDLVLGGNQFNFQPQLERLDASEGSILLNDGKGNLQWQEAGKTGLALKGQLRDIVEIKGRKENYLLFLQNDQVPELYRVNGP